MSCFSVSINCQLGKLFYTIEMYFQPFYTPMEALAKDALWNKISENKWIFLYLFVALNIPAFEPVTLLEKRFYYGIFCNLLHFPLLSLGAPKFCRSYTTVQKRIITVPACWIFDRNFWPRYEIYYLHNTQVNCCCLTFFADVYIHALFRS